MTAITGSSVAQHARNKQTMLQFLDAIFAEDCGPVLDRHCAADCVWEIFHPFNTLTASTVAERFWGPLRAAMPNAEFRCAAALAGLYEERELVSCWGQVEGTFDAPWLGIPPTRGLATLRFGFNAIVRDGLFTKIYVLLDIVDLMRQAGYYPLRRMPGSPEAWFFPPYGSNGSVDRVDEEEGATSIRIVREMQVALPPPNAYRTAGAPPSKHSHHWHPAMNWFGPAGIGSMRAERGFRDFHGALFLQAFPDRSGFVRDPAGPEDAPGHYVRLGDGCFAVTAGWPSLSATHTGSEWLGLAPTGRRVEMRVADWYRLDRNRKIIDNWVMMDVPHILHQMGLDIFHDLEFAADPGRPRWPMPAES